MANKRPNNFPIKSTLSNDVELYTQTDGINEKFTLEQLNDFLVLTGSTMTGDTDWVEDVNGVWNDTSNIGIGLSDPFYTLDVSGDSRLTSSLGVMANVADDANLIGVDLNLGAFNGGLFYDETTFDVNLYGFFGASGTTLSGGIARYNIPNDKLDFLGFGEFVDLSGGTVVTSQLNDVSERSLLWTRVDGLDLLYFTAPGALTQAARIAMTDNGLTMGIGDDNLYDDITGFDYALTFKDEGIKLYVDGNLAATWKSNSGTLNYIPELPTYISDASASSDVNLDQGAFYKVVGSNIVKVKL